MTALYDNFIAYRSKIFRADSPLVRNKNDPKSLDEPSAIAERNPLWQPIPLDLDQERLSNGDAGTSFKTEKETNFTSE